MSDHANSERWDSAGERRPERREQDADEPYPGVESVETYEIDEGVVFFDAENPLAWVEASSTISLHEYA